MSDTKNEKDKNKNGTYSARNEKDIEHELNELKEEVRIFKAEKERVKAILGSIGGVPTFNDKVLNVAFSLSIVVLFVISWTTHETLIKLEMIELTVIALTLKIIFIIHKQSKVDHFKLWILSAMEWRMNEILKETKNSKKMIGDLSENSISEKTQKELYEFYKNRNK